MNDSISAAKSQTRPSQRIPLTVASLIVQVPYHTMMTAHRSHRLKLIYEEPNQDNQSVKVDLIDLVEYMTKQAPKKRRWDCELVPIERIHAERANQPRQSVNTAMIENITSDVLMGAAVEPVWVLKDSHGRYVLVDGFHRYDALLAAQARKISVIEIRIPLQYEAFLIMMCNRRHGFNVNETDLGLYVEGFLKWRPHLLDGIREGTLVQAKLAVDLGVSSSTLTRALQSMANLPAEKPDTPSEVFDQLESVLKRIETSDSLERALIATILVRKLEPAVRGLSPEIKSLVRKQIKLNTSPITHGLNPAVLKSLDRRGGDRSKKTANRGAQS